ncbi:MEDS domain-containing protein [Pseudonocardia sp.]|uniref:MEDS domain-containing protein n=1 Tax=Pseudonocardia sp. TaxID=60912 RepID=UPI003D0E1B0D
MQQRSIDLGIPGVHLVPGDHICAFYPGLTERDEIVIPYLDEGLRAGDKCICVVDGTAPEVILTALADLGVDVDPCLERGQLEVQQSQETYLSGGGFSTPTMIDFWEDSIGGALSGEFSFARAVGEMTWALRQAPGVEELIEYESRLNRYLPRYPQVILCLYELDRFSGEVLVDVLKTHPKVLLGGMLLQNPYYLEPDEFLAGRA